ncbi:unannotated protein [freshwater metagenome]|uniref:Unannotated protein n=1 Tax=freshwater metagenome TaxID=449393 RepID=A0A6J7UMM5_9ZZZZ
MLFTVTTTFDGTPGTVRGATAGEDGNEKPLYPAVFFAATLKVYSVPFVRVVTTSFVAADAVCVMEVHAEGLPVHD